MRQEYDKNDFIQDNEIKNREILICLKYGISSEEYYEIAKKLQETS